LHPSTGIHHRPQRIAAEYADGLQIACGSRRPHRIAECVYSWRESRRILVLRVRKESKRALPGLRGEHGSGDILLQEITLAIEQEEKEGLVFNDRAAKPSTELVAVFVIRPDAIQIVEVIVGIELRVRFVQNSEPRY
jgi:hypothetical protein